MVKKLLFCCLLSLALTACHEKNDRRNGVDLEENASTVTTPEAAIEPEADSEEQARMLSDYTALVLADQPHPNLQNKVPSKKQVKSKNIPPSGKIAAGEGKRNEVKSNVSSTVDGAKHNAVKSTAKNVNKAKVQKVQPVRGYSDTHWHVDSTPGYVPEVNVTVTHEDADSSSSTDPSLALKAVAPALSVDSTGQASSEALNAAQEDLDQMHEKVSQAKDKANEILSDDDALPVDQTSDTYISSESIPSVAGPAKASDAPKDPMEVNPNPPEPLYPPGNMSDEMIEQLPTPVNLN